MNLKPQILILRMKNYQKNNNEKIENDGRIEKD